MPPPMVKLSATSTAAPMGMAKVLNTPPSAPPYKAHFAPSRSPIKNPVEVLQQYPAPASAPPTPPPTGVINCIAAKPSPSRICSPSSKTAINKARYLILLVVSHIELSSGLGFFLPQRKNLRRVGGDYLVLGVAGDDFDGDMLEACKKYPLPHVGLQQQKLFFVGEVEGFLQAVNRRRRLLEQNLYRGVGNHRQAVRRFEEVVNILRNSREPQVIFASALCHRVEERRRVVGFHHPPRLVDDQQALFERSEER